MLALALNFESGLYICQDGAKRKEVYFRNGQVVYVGSNEPSELLGEHLVESGVLRTVRKVRNGRRGTYHQYELAILNGQSPHSVFAG